MSSTHIARVLPRGVFAANRIAIVTLIRVYKPDTLVHCGTNSALAYRDNLLQAFREDAEGTANILEALTGYRDCRLIYFSSSYCYSGLPRNEAVSETTPLRPVHNFGLSKAFFEQLMLRNHPNTIVFRLSSVFGPGNALHPNAVYDMAKAIDKEITIAEVALVEKTKVEV